VKGELPWSGVIFPKIQDAIPTLSSLISQKSENGKVKKTKDLKN